MDSGAQLVQYGGIYGELSEGISRRFSEGEILGGKCPDSHIGLQVYVTLVNTQTHTRADRQLFTG